MERNQYHFTLSDGVTTLGLLCCDPSGRETSLAYWRRSPMQRTSIKLGTGRTQYSDFELPFYTIAQDDWAGGRGGKNLLDDPTKYADGNGTMPWIPKRLTLGPEVHTDETWAGPTFGMTPEPATGGVVGVNGEGGYYIAQTFTPATTETCRGVRFYVSKDLAGYADFLLVDLYSTSGGNPDAYIYGEEVVLSPVAYDKQVVTVWFDTPQVLTASTTYAIVMWLSDTGAGDADVTWYGHATSQYTGQALKADYGEGWVNHPTVADFGLEIIIDWPEVRFFNYRGLLYAAATRGDRGGSLYRRGMLGLATSATRNTLTDTSETFSSADNEKIVRITSGTGAGQWNTVSSATGNTLTMAAGWEIIPDATSVYALVGTWEIVTAITSPVTDVCVVDTTVYLAKGAGYTMSRYQWTNAGGDSMTADGSNQADYLVLFRDQDNDPCLWRALGYEVSNAALQAWGTNLTFNTALRVGSSDSRVTALTVYDDHLYIGKEDGLWALQEEIVRQVPVDFAALRSADNCKGMRTWNLYLIFPILYGLQRLYGTQVDDFGPNTGEGLPDGRQGPISALMPMPGMLVAAVDGGDESSAVMVYNQLGWHELARSQATGYRITGLSYEALPDGQNRIYWNEGPYMRYAWMSGVVFDRSRDARADYAESGTLESGWLGTDLMDVVKLWDEVTVFGTGTVTVEYKADGASTWSTATEDTTRRTTTKRVFSLGQVQTRRLKIRLTLTIGGDDSTPVIEAVTVDALGRVPPGYSYTTPVKVDTMAVTMHGQQVRVAVGTVLAQLATWASAPTPLTMRHVLDECDNRYVMLEPSAESVETWTADGSLEQKRVVTMTLVDVGAVPS